MTQTTWFTTVSEMSEILKAAGFMKLPEKDTRASDSVKGITFHFKPFPEVSTVETCDGYRLAIYERPLAVTGEPSTVIVSLTALKKALTVAKKSARELRVDVFDSDIEIVGNGFKEKLKLIQAEPFNYQWLFSDTSLKTDQACAITLPAHVIMGFATNPAYKKNQGQSITMKFCNNLDKTGCITEWHHTTDGKTIPNTKTEHIVSGEWENLDGETCVFEINAHYLKEALAAFPQDAQVRMHMARDTQNVPLYLQYVDDNLQVAYKHVILPIFRSERDKDSDAA